MACHPAFSFRGALGSAPVPAGAAARLVSCLPPATALAMTQIHGVDAQLYHRLPPEDQAAIRSAWQQRQDEPPAAATPAAQPAAEAARPAPPVADPAAATSARDAVGAIHAMPLPDTSDLARPPLRNMPPEDVQSIRDSRNATFNEQRADAAQAALDRLAPQRSDFDALPPRTAQFEFEQARQGFDADPYVRELHRIVDEATTAPTDIPGYLDARAPAADVNAIPLPQARGALALLGVELPETATPEQIAAGYELLGTVPDDILGPLVNPGYSVGMSSGLGSLGTPGMLPVRGEARATLEGEVELSEVRTGTGFEDTQRLQASVEIRGEVGVDLGKTPLQRIYGWADRLNALPDSVRQLADGSPVLRQVMKGLPVSGSYHQFEGHRLDYEAIVTPEQGARLAEGDLDGLPDPLDPLSMPTGSSVLMRGQSLEGSAFEANWKAFTIGSEHVELSGLGFSVSRMEGSIVEVAAGPVETVENELFIGLGRQGTAAIGIGSRTSLEDRQMDVARIDLSTAEGQAAYQHFMATGQVPQWSPPGVPQSGTMQVFDAEHARFAGIELGGFKAAIDDDSQFTIRDTTWSDGSIDRQTTYLNSGGLATDVRYRVGADGTPAYDDAQWTVVRAGLDPVLASYLEAAYSGAPGNNRLEGERDVQLDFSTSELMAIRDQARDSVEALQGEEKLANLDAGIETPWWSSTQERLAVAKTPEEVFAVLSDDRHGGTVIEDMLGMAFESGEPFPGDFRMRAAG